jgi:hypothetical protein
MRFSALDHGIGRPEWPNANPAARLLD